MYIIVFFMVCDRGFFGDGDSVCNGMFVLLVGIFMMFLLVRSCLR